MKKITFLLMTAFLLTACSVDPVENEADFAGLDVKARATTEDVAEEPMGFYTGQNNGRQLKGTLEISNDCDNLYIKIVPTGGEVEDDADFGLFLFVKDEMPEVNNGQQLKQDPHFSREDMTGDGFQWELPLSNFDTTKQLNIFVKAFGDYAGSSEYEGVQYTAYTFSLEHCICEENFSYVDNEDGTYTFTYVPSENIDNAQLTFTFPQNTVKYSPPVFNQNGNGNDTTFSNTMDLNTCEEYNWTFGLSADCQGKGQSSVNLWTDFKVNEVSKKGELSNIVASCN